MLWNELKQTMDIWRTPSAAELASRELADAERKLLDAQSGREFADAMVRYHTDRINRLRRFLRESGNAS